MTSSTYKERLCHGADLGPGITHHRDSEKNTIQMRMRLFDCGHGRGDGAGYGFGCSAFEWHDDYKNSRHCLLIRPIEAAIERIHD